MPTYGQRPDDVVQDSRGNAKKDVTVTLFATEADATANTSSVGSALTDARGRWSFATDLNDLWARLADGTVWQIAESVDGVVAAAEAASASASSAASAAAQAAASADAVGSTKVDKGALVVSALDYATGDGVSDDTVALGDALAAATGGTLVLPQGKTFKATSGLTVPSGTRIVGYGATLDFTDMPVAATLGEKIALSVTGGIGSDITIATAITQWSRTVAGISSTATLAAGDIVLIENDERPVPGMTRTDRDKGELAIIESVDSGTQVTLTAGALFAYGTTGLKLRKLTPAERVSVEGVSIVLGGIGSAHNGIEVRYGRGVTVRNVVIDGAEDIAIGLHTVWGGKVSDCQISNSTSSTTLGNTGYGVAVLEGSRHCVVADNNFYNCRHFVAGGGYWPPAFVDVKGNQGVRSSDAGYDCHESCFYWTFTKNTAVGVASGFIIRGQYVTVEGCEITDSAGRAYRASTFDGVTEQRGVRLINNKATSAAYGIEVDGQAAGAEPNCLKIDVEIRGNYLRNAGPNPILLRHFDGAKVDENTVIGSTSHAVLLLGLSGTQSKTLGCSLNRVRSSGLDSIKVQYVDDVTVSGGALVNSGGSGIELLTCNRTSVSGTLIRTHAQNGIFVSGGSGHAVTGVSVSGGASASYDAVRFSGTDSVAVSGGYFAGPRYGVSSTTTSNVAITGVNAVNATGSAGVKVSSDAVNKVVANNLV